MLARSPKISRTMQAIARAVEALPPFPVFTPMPDMDGKFHDGPCRNPRARYMPKAVCHCGWMMGEHNTKATK